MQSPCPSRQPLEIRFEIVLVRQDSALLTRMGRAAMLWMWKSHPGSRQAHEHYRAWQSVSAIVAGVGWSLGVGLEALPAVREHVDDQERRLPAPSVVLGAARDGAGATPLVSWLSQFVFGAVGVAGWRQLVCPGGAPRGCGSLAARGDVVAADGRDPAFLDGSPRAVAAVAAIG